MDKNSQKSPDTTIINLNAENSSQISNSSNSTTKNTINNKPITATKKYLALTALITQCAALVLVMRYAKTKSNTFLNTTAVVMNETFKLVTCLILTFIELNYSITGLIKHLKFYLLDQFFDTLKVAVPAFVYVVQNNLLYLAVGNLPAATFQVTYQIKLLTTALFSVTMLGRRLSVRQWLALLILFAGVAIVQLNNSESVEKASEGLEQNALQTC